MIRPREDEDLDGCVSLLREVHDADRYPMRWPADPGGWLIGRQPLGAWIAEQGGRLVGHVALNGTDRRRAHPQWLEALAVPAGNVAVVSRFYVARNARRRGVGAGLLSRAEQHAGEHGLRLALDVADHNHAAIAFYRRRGWRQVGRTELRLDGPPGTLPLVLFVLP